MGCRSCRCRARAVDRGRGGDAARRGEGAELSQSASGPAGDVCKREGRGSGIGASPGDVLSDSNGRRRSVRWGRDGNGWGARCRDESSGWRGVQKRPQQICPSPAILGASSRATPALIDKAPVAEKHLANRGFLLRPFWHRAPYHHPEQLSHSTFTLKHPPSRAAPLPVLHFWPPPAPPTRRPGIALQPATNAAARAN